MQKYLVKTTIQMVTILVIIQRMNLLMIMKVMEKTLLSQKELLMEIMRAKVRILRILQRHLRFLMMTFVMLYIISYLLMKTQIMSGITLLVYMILTLFMKVGMAVKFMVRNIQKIMTMYYLMVNAIICTKNILPIQNIQKFRICVPTTLLL